MLKHSLRYSEAVSIKSSIELYYTAILAVLKKNAQDCLWQSLARNAHLFLPSQLAGCISLQMAFFKQHNEMLKRRSVAINSPNR